MHKSTNARLVVVPRPATPVRPPMSAPRFLPTLLLALLLGASLLAATPAGGFPVTANQASLVRAEYDDPAAPFMVWQPRITTNTFYLKSAPTGPEGVPGGDPDTALPPTPDQVVNANFNATIPTREVGTPITFADGLDGGDYGNQVLFGCGDECLGNEAPAPPPTVIPAMRFPLHESLHPVDEMRLYGFGTSVWAGCQRGNLGGDPEGLLSGDFRLIARLLREVRSGGSWVPDPAGGQIVEIELVADFVVPGTVAYYSGSATFGDAIRQVAPTLKAGQRLVAEYQVPDEFSDVFCVLYYDGTYRNSSNTPFFSQLTVTSDAQRMAAFPADPATGLRQTGFPSASSADATGRRLAIEALVATAWGPQPDFMAQLANRHANVRLFDLEAQRYVYYVDNVGGAPREHEEGELRLVSSRATELTPHPDVEEHLGAGVLRRSFVFAYPADLPDLKRLETQFYSFSDGWEVKAETFSIGGKSIDFRLLATETPTHLVNPGEPTEFGFVVRNTGTAEDVITVAASDPGAGWTARVLGGGKFFVKPGGFAVGSVEVVPPASAADGSRPVTLTASSSFADVADPPAVTVTVEVTGTLLRKLDIDVEAGEFNVRPGVTKGYSATVRNLGTARDSVVIIPSFPANVQGWTIRTNPASAQVVAGGFAEIQVLITPPASAPTGMTFPLGLTVAEVGNSAVSDRVDVTVVVGAVNAVVANLYDPLLNRTLRERGANQCQGAPNQVCGAGGVVGTPLVDNDFDNTAIFRIPVTNNGDREVGYKVEAYWDDGIFDFTDVGTCDTTTGSLGLIGGPPSGANPDGIPDGWRFNYAGDVGQPLPTARTRGRDAHNDFSGIYLLNGTPTDANPTRSPFVVPARATRDLVLEIGYLTGDVCPGNNANPAFGPDLVTATQRNKASMSLVVTSLANPTETAKVPLKAVVSDDGTGRLDSWSGAVHSVDVLLNHTQAASAATLKGQAAAFEMVAVNRGNERDNLRIAVSGNPGWQHQVVVDRTTSGVSCDAAKNNGTSVTCPRVGVYDEVRFRVLATPRDSVPIGERDPITVTVFSGDAPGVFDTQSLTARAAGTLAFSTRVLGDATRTVAAGRAVAFPIEISNDGTADDSYRVTVTQASDAAWRPVVSASAPLFVPAGFDVPAFVTVSPPATLPAGTDEQFTVQVESVASGSRQVLQLVGVTTSAGTLTLAGAGGQDVLLPQRGVAQDVTVVATKLTGAPGDRITFRVDRDSLPADWSVDDGEADADRDITRNLTVGAGSPLPRATATFKVTAPADALGTARAILHVDAVTNTTLRAATDLALDLASTKGVQLTLGDNATQVIAPGGPATYNLTLRNLGLGQDTVSLTNSQLPAGWTLVLNPAAATLGPLQAMDVTAKLSAPTSARPGDQASVVLFAASTGDPGQVASQVLRAQVGFNALRIAPVSGEDLWGAPQETVTRVLNVTNTGTLPDQVAMRPVIDTSGLRRFANQTSEPALFTLKANETRQVAYSITFGDGIPSNTTLQATARAVSLLDGRPEAQRANASSALRFHVLPYQVLDVNGDGLDEYAVDRDRDASDGFEEFKPNAQPGGNPLDVPDLARFLREDARAAFERDVTLPNGTVQRVLVHTVDGDGDLKRDLFLDRDGDDQPDFYWDPDANQASPIEFRKDVNGDQVPESFVDTDGDGKQDAVYDLTRGAFTDVIQIDVDGDRLIDYVVDKDGDGQVDQDETVLYTRDGGRLLIVQKVDVDGDERLDQVFDVDGDGNPDHFIPAGSTDSVPIAMRDVNGDGVMDWTFDGDNDGRKESYYDPATGRSHSIDAAGHLADALREHWYIGALFGLVLLLFVALVLVTRR
jgi:uncharacterized membrane protein